MKNYKSIICVAAAVCLLGTAAFCGFRIYHHYAQVDEQTEAFEEIAEMVEQAPTEETMPDDAPVSEGEDVLAGKINIRLEVAPSMVTVFLPIKNGQKKNQRFIPLALLPYIDR